jgi:SAM-dependent methyltransferase
MSKSARIADFVEWDVRNWSGALDFWLAHTRQKLSNTLALELGSRNGGLSLWLALQGARVICSDICPPHPETIQLHKDHGVTHLIRYERVDATDIPYTEEFDVIVFKSVLGAIRAERQATAISDMHKALKTGGELFFAENLEGSPLHQSLRRRFVPWGTSWQYVSTASLEACLSAFSRVEHITMGFAGAFGRGEKQRDVLGMLDKLIFDRIVPATWRYIIAGVAVK